MAIALVRTFSKEQLEEIVKTCTSMRELERKLGYGSIGNNGKTIQKVLNEYGISTEHFTGQAKNTVVRSEENVFIKNSTATQATLRRWYIKGKYSEYKCAICGQPPIWNNKPLTLTLDHINGNNTDDRLENLRWICPNCDRQLDTFAGKNVELSESPKYYCIDCGVEISYGHIRCLKCEQQHRKQIGLSSIPLTRDELKYKIKTQSFTSIGNEFGVSDNAIRKWCIKLNLPTTKKQIKNYSDEEWELL